MTVNRSSEEVISMWAEDEEEKDIWLPLEWEIDWFDADICVDDTDWTFRCLNMEEMSPTTDIWTCYVVLMVLSPNGDWASVVVECVDNDRR